MSDPLGESQAQLDAATDRLRRAKLGPPLALSDAQLDSLAEVGPTDAPVADVLWRRANPGPLSRLLDAEPEPEP